MDSSFKSVVKEKCDRCEKSFEAEVWRIINVIERPDLAEQIENDTIYEVTCPHCQFQQRADKFFISHNDKASKTAFHFPKTTSEKRRLQIIGKFYFSLGIVAIELGLYQTAIEFFEECRQLQEKVKDIPDLAIILFELARLYHRTGRLEQARLYFKGTLRLFRRIKDEEKIAAVLTALGNLEMQIGKLNQACKHLQEAREYYQQENRLERLKEVNKLLKLLPDNNTAEKV